MIPLLGRFLSNFGINHDYVELGANAGYKDVLKSSMNTKVLEKHITNVYDTFVNKVVEVISYYYISKVILTLKGRKISKEKLLELATGKKYLSIEIDL
jgi:hypothetical protein